MKLKKARKCGGCLACQSTVESNRGYCELGFKVNHLSKDKLQAGRYSFGDYWAILIEPAEPCYKPTTIRQLVAANKLRFNIQ